MPPCYLVIQAQKTSQKITVARTLDTLFGQIQIYRFAFTHLKVVSRFAGIPCFLAEHFQGGHDFIEHKED